MERITIVKLFREKRKSSQGKEYERVAVKTQEYGDKWLSGFGGAWNGAWKEGDVATVKVSRVEKDGKEYLNFDRVSEYDLISDKLDVIIGLLQDDRSKKSQEVDPNDSMFDEIDPGQ